MKKAKFNNCYDVMQYLEVSCLVYFNTELTLLKGLSQIAERKRVAKNKIYGLFCLERLLGYVEQNDDLNKVQSMSASNDSTIACSKPVLIFDLK